MSFNPFEEKPVQIDKTFMDYFITNKKKCHCFAGLCIG